MNAETFNTPGRREHARAWAAGYYGEASADLFVAWLLSESDEVQDRIYRLGYVVAARHRFEQDFWQTFGQKESST